MTCPTNCLDVNVNENLSFEISKMVYVKAPSTKVNFFTAIRGS